ncbi:uncharacterized protein LOC144451677 [Glandiceps talaboti]
MSSSHRGIFCKEIAASQADFKAEGTVEIPFLDVTGNGDVEEIEFTTVINKRPETEPSTTRGGRPDREVTRGERPEIETTTVRGGRPDMEVTRGERPEIETTTVRGGRPDMEVTRGERPDIEATTVRGGRPDMEVTRGERPDIEATTVRGGRPDMEVTRGERPDIEATTVRGGRPDMEVIRGERPDIETTTVRGGRPDMEVTRGERPDIEATTVRGGRPDMEVTRGERPEIETTTVRGGRPDMEVTRGERPEIETTTVRGGRPDMEVTRGERPDIETTTVRGGRPDMEVTRGERPEIETTTVRGGRPDMEVTRGERPDIETTTVRGGRPDMEVTRGERPDIETTTVRGGRPDMEVTRGERPDIEATTMMGEKTDKPDMEITSISGGRPGMEVTTMKDEIPVPEPEHFGCRKPIAPWMANLEIQGDQGQTMFDEHTFLSIRCPPGFMKDGPEVSECLNGRWMPPIWHMRCLAGCLVPKKPMNNGVFTNTTGRHGDSICLHCNRSYVLRGPEVSNCHNGTWYPPLTRMECVAHCRNPGIPINGHQVGMPSYEAGSWVKFQCKPGFELFGNQFIKCVNGHWSAPLPTCRAHCVNPGFPKNGMQVGFPTYEIYSWVEFRCRQGYELYGNRFTRCVNGKWAHPLPTCLAHCRDPGVPVHGMQIGQPTYYSNSWVEFKCRYGYQLYGHRFMKCINGTWNYPRPTCIGSCSEPILSRHEDAVLPIHFVNFPSHLMPSNSDRPPIGVDEDNRRPPGEGSGQRPGQGSGQQPGEGSGQQPGEGSGQQPGEGNGQQPGEGSGQQPGEGNGRQPGEGSGQQPGEGNGQQPGEGSGEQPGEGNGRQPGEGNGQQPGEGSGQQPGEGSGQQPGEGSGQKPGEGNGQQPGEGNGQQPGEGNGQQPGEGNGQQPGEGNGQLPGEGSGQQPGEGNGQQPGEGNGQQPGEGNGQQPGEGNGQLPDEGSGQQPGEGNGQQPGEGSDQKPDEGNGQQPGEGNGQQPGEGSGQQSGEERGEQPDDGRGQQPGEGNEQQPGEGSGEQSGDGRGQQPGEGNEQQPGEGSGQQPDEGSGQQPGEGSGQQPGEGSGQQPGEGSGQQPGEGSGEQSGEERGQQPGGMGGNNNMPVCSCSQQVLARNVTFGPNQPPVENGGNDNITMQCNCTGNDQENNGLENLPDLPPEIPNFKPDEYPEGAKFYFDCEPGFFLVGHDMLRCHNQRWSGEVPYCVDMATGEPPELVSDWFDEYLTTEASNLPDIDSKTKPKMNPSKTEPYPDITTPPVPTCPPVSKEGSCNVTATAQGPAFSSTLVIETGYSWDGALADPSSCEYNEAAAEFSYKLAAIFNASSLSNDFDCIDVSSFRQGSVEIDYKIVLDEDTQVNESDIQVAFFEGLNNTDVLEDVEINEEAIAFVVFVPTTPSPTEPFTEEITEALTTEFKTTKFTTLAETTALPTLPRTTIRTTAAPKATTILPTTVAATTLSKTTKQTTLQQTTDVTTISQTTEEETTHVTTPKVTTTATTMQRTTIGETTRPTTAPITTMPETTEVTTVSITTHLETTSVQTTYETTKPTTAPLMQTTDATTLLPTSKQETTKPTTVAQHTTTLPTTKRETTSAATLNPTTKRSNKKSTTPRQITQPKLTTLEPTYPTTDVFGYTTFATTYRPTCPPTITRGVCQGTIKGQMFRSTLIIEVGIEWKDELVDAQSCTYGETAAMFSAMLADVFNSTELANYFDCINVDSFTKGSVEITYDVVVEESAEVSEEIVQEAFIEGMNKTAVFEEMVIDKEAIVFVPIVVTSTMPTDHLSTISSYSDTSVFDNKVVLMAIVLGAVLVVLVIALAVSYVTCNRKRQRPTKRHRDDYRPSKRQHRALDEESLASGSSTHELLRRHNDEIYHRDIAMTKGIPGPLDFKHSANTWDTSMANFQKPPISSGRSHNVMSSSMPPTDYDGIVRGQFTRPYIATGDEASRVNYYNNY